MTHVHPIVCLRSRGEACSCFGSVMCMQILSGGLTPCDIVQDGGEHRDYWISDGLYGGFNNIQVL